MIRDCLTLKPPRMGKCDRRQLANATVQVRPLPAGAVCVSWQSTRGAQIGFIATLWTVHTRKAID